MKPRNLRNAAVIRRRMKHMGESRTGGFTLVELAVVLVLLGILLALSVGGILGYRDYAAWKQNNEAAASIFVAAQTQLTQYSERGCLTDLMDAVSEYGKADPREYQLQKAAGDDVAMITWAKDQNGREHAGEIWFLKTGRLEDGRWAYDYYADSLQDRSWKELENVDDRRIKVLFDMLDPYIMQKELLRAAICIEFDPDPDVAQVCSVFYNDRAGAFSYEAEHEETDGLGDTAGIGSLVSLADRSENHRKTCKTGYYGADTLAKATSGAILCPAIHEFRLNNEETLNLTWKVSGGDERALTGMIYTIGLFDMSNEAAPEGRLMMQITLGSADEPAISPGKNRLAWCMVRQVQEDGELGPAVPVEFPVDYSISGETLTLVLDGLDVAADETKLTAGANAGLMPELSDTASVMRLNLPADLLRVSINGSRAGIYNQTMTKYSNTEHLYFGSREETGGAIVYTIDNLRHFHNIRFQEARQDGAAEERIEYRLTADLDWGRALAFGTVYDHLLTAEMAEGQQPELCLKPLLRLRRGSVLTSDNTKQRRTLSRLVLDINHMQTGLSEGIPAGVIGLVVVNEGTISNLVLSDVSVNGVLEGRPESAVAAGGFCGRNQGSLKNLTVWNSGDGAGSIIRGVSHVGGILGETAAEADSEVVCDGLINYAQVQGQLHIGGIAGSLEAGSGETVVKNCENYGRLRGVMVCPELSDIRFLGGIAGSTDGQAEAASADTYPVRIENCRSFPDYMDQEPDERWRIPDEGGEEPAADFVGGIVGYNGCAWIHGCSIVQEYQSRQGCVTGRNYVGGVAGWNGIGAEICGCALQGVSVRGRRFVGGCVGLNLAERFFSCPVLGGPDEVVGDYFVGGILGGNLAVTDKTEDSPLCVKLDTGRSFGMVLAGRKKADRPGAFAGGLIGYNYLLKPQGDPRVQEEKIREAAEALLNAESGDGRELFSPFTGMETDDRHVTEQAGEIETALSQFLFEDANREAVMLVQPVERKPDQMPDQTSVPEKRGIVSGGIYVGGVIGYNQDTTRLIVRDVENTLAAEAVACVVNQDGTGFLQEQDPEHRFSYVGGITGKVGRNVILDHCRNQDMNAIRGCGTYTGGLAEINFGVIRNCSAESIGDGTKSHVGGLVGLNAAVYEESEKVLVRGQILDCTVRGKISGVSYVGGLAAENYGTIRYDASKEAELFCERSVEASGSYVGGLTGYAHETGEIVVAAADKTGSSVDDAYALGIRIQGTARYAGGIAGANAGVIRGSRQTGTITNREDLTVTGRREVGGFVGIQLTEPAASGESKSAVLAYFENHAYVQAQEGYAGGITAVNGGRIEVCGNYGEIRADQGVVGGIAAVNTGIIQNSETGYEVSEDAQGSRTQELSGGELAGGITAVNESGAVIEDCFVQNLILRSRSGSVGGVAAWNKSGARIEACSVGAKTRGEAAGYVAERMEEESFCLDKSGVIGNTVVLISDTQNINMGGVAGVNDGIIHGKSGHQAEGSYTVVAAQLQLPGENRSRSGNVGGIAGINSGQIEQYEFSGFVHGAAAGKEQKLNSGGIAGRNGREGTEADSAVIRDCFLGMVKITGAEDSSSPVNVGGVAGFNGKGAVIRNIAFSRAEAGNSTDLAGLGIDRLFPFTENQIRYFGTVHVDVSGRGHVGGVVGYNDGQISDVNWSEAYMENRQEAWVDRDQGDTVYKGYFENGSYTDTELAPVDKTGVLVTGQTGHVGGIAGCSGQTGTVRQAVTGRLWLVYAGGYEENDGTGGIIGCNRSGQELVSCDNHATVIRRTDGSDSVGGIMGCCENDTGSWHMSNCRNYGAVIAAANAAGMIGTWKYRGGTLEDCLNFGDIRTVQSKRSGAGSGKASGGMAGVIWQAEEGESFRFVCCENHGRIRAAGPEAAAGGFVGEVAGGKRPVVSVYDSVNTGMTGAPGISAGFVADVQAGTRLEVKGCRNYGYGDPADLHPFAGITAYTSMEGPVKLEDCFGVTDVASEAGHQPVSPLAADNAGGYYFMEAGDSGSAAGTSPETDADELGTLLAIRSRTDGTAGYEAASRSGRVMIPLGDYNMEDIRNGRGSEKTQNPWILCKGTAARTGLDLYLKPVYSDNGQIAFGKEVPDIQTRWDKSEMMIAEEEAEPVVYPLMGSGLSDEASEFTALQKRVSLELADDTDRYRVILIQSEQPADLKASPSDAAYAVQDVSELELIRRTESEYELHVRTTDRSAEDCGNVKTILLREGEEELLPYREPVPVMERDGQYLYLEIQPAICLELTEQGTRKLSILLPDCEDIFDEELSLGLTQLTDQILVQPAAGTWPDSDWAWMRWEGDRLVQDSWICLEDEAHSYVEPEGLAQTETIVAEHAASRGVRDTAYILDLRGQYHYVVTASIDGNVLGTCSVPYQTDSAEAMVSQQVWLPKKFAAYAGKTVTLQFQTVFGSGTVGGISALPKAGTQNHMYQAELPEPEPVQMEEPRQGLSEERMYEVSIHPAVLSSGIGEKKGRKKARLQPVYVRQYQVVWEHRLNDMEITGYELTIHKEDPERDYELELDLRRGWFGSLPGLRDCLADDGRLLYVTPYYMEGDAVCCPADVPKATPSDADAADEASSAASAGKASPSNLVLSDFPPSDEDKEVSDPSDQMGVLALECRLRAEYLEYDGEPVVRFTLILPDASFAGLRGAAAVHYQNAYEYGLYQTEAVQIVPVTADHHGPSPIPEWCCLEKYFYDPEHPDEYQEADGLDGELEDDRNKKGGAA